LNAVLTKLFDFPLHPRSFSPQDHYQVAIVQADGKYDLEKGENNGDEGDLWKPGMKLTPNNDGKTWPNTDSYQSGQVSKSGVTIEILEENGLNMKIKVTMTGRSGNNAPPPLTTTTAFSAPFKDHEAAAAQFQAGDQEEFPISGKIPQLPWFEEHQEEQRTGQGFVSRGEGIGSSQKSPKEIGEGNVEVLSGATTRLKYLGLTLLVVGSTTLAACWSTI
jgi:hypothetical protein